MNTLLHSAPRKLLPLAPVVRRHQPMLKSFAGRQTVTRHSSGTRPLTPLLLTVLLMVGFVMAGLPTIACAQQATPSPIAYADLPDAPGSAQSAPPSAGPQPAAQAAPQPATASLTGTILDSSGATVSGAHVTLSGGGLSAERKVLSSPNGEFLLDGLPSGTFKLTVNAPGLQTFVSPELLLAPEEKRELPAISLPIATANTDVQVFANQEEIAQEQLHDLIKQRTFGVFPNFYSSFVWDAAPLNTRQKFNLALRSTTDPVIFITSGIVAGVEQAHNTFPAYGQDAAGFAKRYGAAYGDSFLGRMIGSAALPSLFRQDPRYFYKGSGSVRSRAFYAVEAAFVCRGDNGRQQPNFSHILGNFAAGGISNLYHDPADRSTALALRSGAVITAGNMVSNLLREFVLRQHTTNVPDYANGKP